MAAFFMDELAPTEVVDFDAFKRNQLLCLKASTHDEVSQVGHVSASWRVLQVMVVDDEQHTADTLTGLVRRWGHAARLAYDGLAALRVAAAQDPDVVVLDLEMPFMDGCQVARHLRLDFPNKECLIIAVMEQADDVRRQQCIEAGIDLVLIKPIDPGVVETLLLLEAELVNRSRTDNGLAKKGSVQFNRRRMRGMLPRKQVTLV